VGLEVAEPFKVKTTPTHRMWIEWHNAAAQAAYPQSSTELAIAASIPNLMSLQPAGSPA
jgi:hypothetical protein